MSPTPKALRADKLPAVSASQIRSAERTLSAGTWSITFGAILFSVLTVTPLVRGVTPNGWESTAPVLPLVVDAAVVIVIRLDSTVARLGGSAGRWPAVLRWLTGLMTLALNIGYSALHGDLVGVAVHAVAPILLIVTAEAGLAYRRAITTALVRIEREQCEQAKREQADHDERARLAREEREHQREAAERCEREAREHAARLEQQRAEREAAERREQRAHEEKLARIEAERTGSERCEQRDAEAAHEKHEQPDGQDRESPESEEREHKPTYRSEHRERQRATARERARSAERERFERPGTTAGQLPPTRKTASAKLSEEEALEAIRSAEEDTTIRRLAERTGWSVGWVSTRMRELQGAA